MKKLILLLSKLIYFTLDLIIPKKDIYVFTSKDGKNYKGNIKYLHIYFSKESLKESYFIHNPYTLKSLVLLLRAKYIFLSHGAGDISYAFNSPRKTITYVGHGITIKKMLFEQRAIPNRVNFIMNAIESRFYKNIIASSEVDAKNLELVFKKRKETIRITGLPRNDHLKSSKMPSEIFKRDGNYILYAPTYRQDEQTKFLDIIPLTDLNDALRATNSYLCIRFHPNETLDMSIFKPFSNILDASSKILKETQEYLFNFDGLITDYSSIYIDFLLADKPIAFYPYDLEAYEEKQGLFFDYKNISPGITLDSKGSIYTFLKSTSDGHDNFKSERKRVKSLFYKYTDSSACKRILEVFE